MGINGEKRTLTTTTKEIEEKNNLISKCFFEKKILLLKNFYKKKQKHQSTEKKKIKMQLIDLDSIIKTKAPKLYPKIPGFLLRKIKNLIHQDEMNAIVENNKDKHGVDFAQAVINYFNIKLEIKGAENLPPDNKLYTFASNHPLGGLDGLALACVLGNKYKNIKIMVNDILMSVKNLQDIFVPINKHGAQGKRSADSIQRSYSSDSQMVVFPAGLVSRKRGGEIRDLDWKKNFISKTVHYQRDIIPIFFEGSNSNFFYRLANFRKKIGIKFNIEMLFLPHEMFKQRNKTFTIKIGKPIPWETFDKTLTHREWALFVKNLVYELK